MMSTYIEKSVLVIGQEKGENLESRIKLDRRQFFAAFGFLFNMLTVFALYLNKVFIAVTVISAITIVIE